MLALGCGVYIYENNSFVLIDVYAIDDDELDGRRIPQTGKTAAQIILMGQTFFSQCSIMIVTIIVCR